MNTYVFNLDGNRLGDWVVIRAESEDAARKRLTRSQRRRVVSVRIARKTSEYRAEAEAAGLPFPVPTQRRRKAPTPKREIEGASK